MATRLKSRHIVKPAEPTWKGIFPLSELDQVSVVTHSSYLYFYNTPTNDKFKSNSLSEDKIIETLKTSLSRVLVPFYPLAGRVSWVGGGRLKLECNAMGAELIEVESNKEMSDFGEFYSSGSMFRDLLPEMDYYNKDIDKFPVLAVQVTRFQCGGLSLGISMSHVVIDGTSAFHFTKEWARLALGQPLEVAPFLDRRVLGVTQDQVKGTNVVVNGSETNKNYLSEFRLTQVKNWGKQLAPIFVRLTKDHIERLKKIANNNDNEKIIEKSDHNNKHERPYTRFEVLAAYVWRCMCLARELKNEDTTSFMAVVDARGRVDTSLLPLSYFGNAIVDAGISSNVGELISRPLSYACGKVRESVEKVNTKYFFEVIEFFKNQPSLSKYQEIDDRGTVQGPSYGDNNVLVVSWLNLQGRGMDFGWGKEVHFGPPIVHACDGDIQISPYKDDGSVVVGVCYNLRKSFLNIWVFLSHKSQLLYRQG